MVLVGEVAEPVDFRSLLKPVDKGGHFSAGCFLDASDADVDDDECHVRDPEVAFGTFPQAELDVSAVIEVVNTGTDRIPVERYVIGVAAEHIGDIGTHIEVNIHDGVTG